MGTLFDASVGLALEKAVDAVKHLFGGRLSSAAARRELVAICGQSLEAAARAAPALREDLSSRSFAESVALPTIFALLQNPTHSPDVAALANKFVAMFVDRYARGGDVDAALERIFQTDRATLDQAFEAFFATLKVTLSESDLWRDLVHQQTAEQTLDNTTELLRLVRELSYRPESSLSLATATEEAQRASSDLLEWPRDIFGDQMERPQFATLLERIIELPAGVSLLIGEAGSGKSALLSTLTNTLPNRGVAVLAIKADRLPSEVRTMDDIRRALGMDHAIEETLRRLAGDGPVVLIIDQLDAVSDVMDRQSSRMRLLLRLIAQFRPSGPVPPPVHIVVSSRPFEADHDARFQQLGAERIRLTLPSREQVNELLERLQIDPTIVPPAIADTVRRPFALKLLVELVRRQVPIDDLLPAELLSRWLATADLGPAGERAEVIRLLTDLAEEMIASEALWRPVDRFEMQAPDALARATAAGLVIRNDRAQISFSHQSWLDDFQAKGFTTGRELAEFAWEGQDSLFPRAAILRTLQRLRLVDPAAYLAAVDLLLGDPRTRRHLKYLVVDLIGTMEPPLPREAAWIERLLREDPVLGRRVFPGMSRAWSYWRDYALGWLPLIMEGQHFAWAATAILGEEMKIDARNGLVIIERFWSGPECDDRVMRTIEASGLWSDDIRNKARSVMARTQLTGHFISHLMTERMKAGESAAAVDLVASFFETGDEPSRFRTDLYELDELAKVEPVALAERLFPLFVTEATREVNPYVSLRLGYPASASLDWDWDYESGHGGFFAALRIALRLAAIAAPQRLLDIVRPYFEVELDEVQSIIADALAAAEGKLAPEALAFLTADTRRLAIGDAHGSDTSGVGQTVMAWSSRQLVRAIIPGLDAEQLTALRDVIEGWDRYPPEALTPAFRLDRMRLRWADEARMALLEPLPKEILGARRRRQIVEWRLGQPVIRSVNKMTMASIVGSPMSNTAMERATDDQIMGMIAALNKQETAETYRRSAFTGGMTQFSQAFAAFAKEKPERAFSILETRLQPGQHEGPAGAALRTLAEVESMSPERVLNLLRALVSRGFEGDTWRYEVAWALSGLARRLNGLEDAEIVLLEGWLDRDADNIADQLARRTLSRQNNEARNAQSDRPRSGPSPLLFGHGRGGQIMPQRNYTLLSAIADGLLLRPEADCDAWIAVLERHVSEPEDSEVWSALLNFRMAPLWWIERNRAKSFLDALCRHRSEAFAHLSVLGTIWETRSLMSPGTQDAIIRQMLAGDERQQQAAGEFLGGIAIVDEPTDGLGALANDILQSGASSARLGYIFSAAAAWREPDAQLRERAHKVLMSLAPVVEGDEAIALARALGWGREAVVADGLTKDLLRAVASTRPLLSAVWGNFFLETLQGFLLYPGFEADVLALVRGLSELARDGGENRLGRGDAVQIAVALQRNDGELRREAMDVYELLLDADVYGAAQAAEAALIRAG